MEYEDKRDAEDAVKGLDGRNGWRVEFARAAGPKGGGGDRYGGGGGGGDRFAVSRRAGLQVLLGSKYLYLYLQQRPEVQHETGPPA